MTLVIQPNPFKQEKFVRTYTEEYSIRELFALQDIDITIENCNIVLNDTVVTDYDIVPDTNDILIIRTLPGNAEAVGAGVGMTAGFGVMVSAIAGSIVGTGAIAAGFVGAGLVGGALLGWGIVAGIKWLLNLDTDEAEEYSLTGKNNSDEQYKPIPVLYGTTKFTPSYGGHSYTSYVDVEPSNWTNHVPTRTTYLHQLYILGYNPIVVHNLKLDDNYLAETKTLSVTATLDATAGTITASGQFDSSSGIYTGAYISVVGSASSDGQYLVDSYTDDALTVSPIISDYAIADETSVAITIDFLITNGPSCFYSDVELELVSDGDLSNTNYRYQVNQTQINKVCKYDTYQYFTTPPNIGSVDLEFGFLKGLGRISKENATSSNGKLRVTFSIEAKQISGTASDWKEISTPKYTAQSVESYLFTEQISDLAQKFGDIAGQYVLRVKVLSIEEFVNLWGHRNDYWNTIDPNSEDAPLMRRELTWLNTKSYIVDSETGNRVAPIDSTTGQDLLLLVVKVKATDQLSGTVDNLTVNATRWVNDYDVDTDSWILRETHNPASMFRDALTNDKLAHHPATYNGTYFDTASLEAWHTWCDTAQSVDYGTDTELLTYTCNGLLLSSTTVSQELIKICSTGRAEYTVIDGRYVINQLIPKTTPVQLFTTRNIIKDSFSVNRAYNDVSDNVVVKYVDADSGYIVNQIETNTTDPTTSQSIDYPYVDNYLQAYALGKFFENGYQTQIITYSFQVGIDNLVATKGDRVGLQHDASLLALSSGRISSFTESGGKLLTVTADEPMLMEAGTTYGITIRTPSGLETYTLVTDAGLQYTVTIDNPTAEDDHNIASGDLFSFGESGSSTEDVIITDIQYDSLLHATITAVPYNSSIYDINSIPRYESSITAPAGGARGRALSVGTTPPTEEAIKELTAIANTSNQQVYYARPLTPYNSGDMWLNGSAIYDCVVSRTNTESYTQSDWRRRSSSTFDVLNKDTFNEATPEHRWQQVPGDALPYNLLASTTYAVTEGDATKDELLIDDNTNWVGTTDLNAVTVTATGVDSVTTEGNFTSAFIAGRYNNSGYMGEAFSNELVGSDAPATQNVSITNGEHYVVQCYRGTITCSYGTASEGSPLEFDATATDPTYTLTMSADCRFGSFTHTDFIPPYVVSGAFTANSGSLSIAGTTMEFTTTIVNIPSDTTIYGITRLYGDATNYIDLYLSENQLHIDIYNNGNNFYDSIDITAGDYVFALDWADDVELRVNYRPYTYSETGGVFGTGDDGFGTDEGDYFGIEAGTINFTTALTTAYIGIVGTDYYNNAFSEIII